MEHHSLATEIAKTTLMISYEALRTRPVDLKDFLRKVGWQREDLEAWLQSSNEVLLVEAVTFFLHALERPDDRGVRATLQSVKESEAGRDYSATMVREANPWPSSRVKEYIVTDPAGLESPVEPESPAEPEPPARPESPARYKGEEILSLLGRFERTMVELRLITHQQLREAHKTSESACADIPEKKPGPEGSAVS